MCAPNAQAHAQIRDFYCQPRQIVLIDPPSLTLLNILRQGSDWAIQQRKLRHQQRHLVTGALQGMQRAAALLLTVYGTDQIAITPAQGMAFVWQGGLNRTRSFQVKHRQAVQQAWS